MISPISEIIEDLKSGKFVIIVDDEDRENEGDLILASDDVNAAAINFMAREARGLICLTLLPDQVEKLKLPMMKSEHHQSSQTETAFTMSIEAKTGITTGISAADRARTIQVATDVRSTADDLIVPGHIFPLRANPNGVLARRGHTEASIDLVRYAGKNPSAVICELINEDGTMSRLPELIQFSQKFNLKIGTINDLVQYRSQNEFPKKSF